MSKKTNLLKSILLMVSVIAISCSLLFVCKLDVLAKNGSCGDSATYELAEDGTLTISGTGAIRDRAFFAPYFWDAVNRVVIGDDITSIGNYAFAQCYSLIDLTIGSSVSSIGDSAFFCCEKLENVEIPDSVTQIGENAFGYCESITSINIPKNVSTVGKGAFGVCSSLERITVDSENSKYDDFDSNVIVETSSGKLIAGCSESTIPSEAKVIAELSFAGNIVENKNIEIPEGVETIEKEAFKGCAGLSGVTISKTVSKVYEGAFYGCRNIMSISVDDENAKYEDRNLNVIIEKESKKLIRGCSGATSIPDNITEIGDYAYASCDLFNEVVIPDGVNRIGDYAFGGANIYGITISKDVNDISALAFSNCTGLRTINVDAANETYADYGQNAIVKKDTRTLIKGAVSNACVQISGEIREIGEGAYMNRSTISSVIIEDGVTSIGARSFAGCNMLKEISIPDSVTSIAENAFVGCNMRQLVIQAVAGSYAQLFADSQGIAYEEIPANLLSKGGYGTTSYILYDDGKLEITGTGTIIDDPLGFKAKKDDIKTVVISAGITEIGANVFSQCGALESVTLPYTLTTIGANAFSRTNISTLDIPMSVNDIGSQAFANCTNLMQVYITEGQMSSIPDDVFIGTPWINSRFSGNCGEGVRYRFKEGVLTLSGTGTAKYSDEVMYAWPWDSYKSQIKKVIVQDGVTGIYHNAFQGCKNLQEVVLPDSLTSLAQYVFSDCTRLKEITIPEKVRYISLGTFDNCTSLEKVVLGNVSFEPNFKFNNCGNLSDINLPCDTNLELIGLDRTKVGGSLVHNGEIKCEKNDDKSHKLVCSACGDTHLESHISSGEATLEKAETCTKCGYEISPKLTPAPTPEPTKEPTPTPKPTEAPKPTATPTPEPTKGIEGNGLVQVDGTWSLVKDGKVQTDYNDLYSDDTLGWWKVTDGVVDFDFNGIYSSGQYGWWLVVNGQPAFGYTGLYGDVNYGWWLIESGMVSFAYNGLYTDATYGTWMIANGAVDFSYEVSEEEANQNANNGQTDNVGGNDSTSTGNVTGLVAGADGNWYLYNNGLVASNYTGIYNDINYGWWLVENGKIAFDYDDIFGDSLYGWWKITGGQVDFGFTGLYSSSRYGWWLINGGQVAFDYSGLYEDVNYGTWMIAGGTVDFSYVPANDSNNDSGNTSNGNQGSNPVGSDVVAGTGLVVGADGNWYLYNEGVFAADYTGLYCDTVYGWWLVVNGKIAFDYTGLYGDANYGWWLIGNGSIAFDYNDLWGDPNYGWWKVVGGTIDFGYNGVYSSPMYGDWNVAGGAVVF